MKTTFFKYLAVAPMMVWCACSSTSSVTKQAMDTRTYYGGRNEYAVNIPAASGTSTAAKDNGGYQDFIYRYVGSDTSVKAYIITVVKVPLPENVTIMQSNLHDATFINSFQGSCGCNIIKTTDVSYTNIQVMQMEVKKQDSFSPWHGYTLNVVHGNALYSIDYLASEANFPKYKSEFKSIMNSFKFTK